jgi:hypothetical protein
MKTITAVSETIKVDSSVQNEAREEQVFSDGDHEMSPVKSTRQANQANGSLIQANSIP